jgi:ABC-2 type transport system permease protein
MSDIENQKGLDPRVHELMKERERIRLEGILKTRIASFEKDRNSKLKQTERELAAKIRGVQDNYKLLAVLLPPIPPILLAFFVYFHRRKAEQEGVDTKRLRYGRSHEQAAA